MTTQQFLVTAERGTGNWWVLEAPEVGAVSQVRRLDQAAGEMREAIAFLAKIPQENVEIVVEPRLSPDYVRLASQAQEERDLANAAAQRASELTRQAALQLRNEGLTLREIGQIMGISFQRASQIVA